MKKFFIKFINIIIIFIFLFSSCSLTVYAATKTAKESNTEETEVSLETKQQTLVNIAKSYYNKKTAVQYDQQRRFLDVKPEEAKAKWPIYLDCSSFVYNVYLQSFNVKLKSTHKITNIRKGYSTKGATKKNLLLNTTIVLLNEAEAEYKANNSQFTDYVPYYVENPKNSITHNQLSNTIKNTLQVGDLLVYYRKEVKKDGKAIEKSGHVYMYIGDQKLIHCTGTSKGGGKYDYTNCVEKRDSQAIRIDTLKETVLDQKNKKERYLRSSTISRFAIIRPLASQALDAQLTDYAKIKNELPKLDIVTTSSPWNLKTVSPGSTVKFYIHLKNNDSKELKNLILTEKISDFLEINPDSITVKGKKKPSTFDSATNTLKVTNLTISKKSEIVISYTATVRNDTTKGDIIKSQSFVSTQENGPAMGSNTISLTVGKTLTKSQQNNIQKVAKTYVGKTYTKSVRYVIDEIYKKSSLKVDTKLGSTSVSTMFTHIMNKDNTLTTSTKQARQMLVTDLYGYFKSANTGARYLSTDNLISGDVIIYKNKSGSFGIYLYLNENELLTRNSKGKIVILKNVQSRLDKLIGYQQFAVLRPSLNMNV